MNYTSALLLCALCSIIVCETAAQQADVPFDSTPYRERSVGAYGSVGLNMHSADIKGLPGIPSCCPTYSTGTGFGFSVGGLYDHVFSPSLSLLGRVGLMGAGGTLTATENTLINTDGSEVQGTFVHTLNTSRLFGDHRAPSPIAGGW
ncbi:MAG: hypothetical protein IPI29_06600 [Ignavibacteria bacterium]|nr:hypothetical protein [Ignavibacteria bacterium]